MNSIASLYNSLPATTNISGQSFCGQSQTNFHSMVPYDVDVDNNDDTKYDYCCLGTDPDFGSYKFLMYCPISNSAVIIWHLSFNKTIYP